MSMTWGSNVDDKKGQRAFEKGRGVLGAVFKTGK